MKLFDSYGQKSGGPQVLTALNSPIKQLDQKKRSYSLFKQTIDQNKSQIINKTQRTETKSPQPTIEHQIGSSYLTRRRNITSKQKAQENVYPNLFTEVNQYNQQKIQDISQTYPTIYQVQQGIKNIKSLTPVRKTNPKGQMKITELWGNSMRKELKLRNQKTENEYQIQETEKVSEFYQKFFMVNRSQSPERNNNHIHNEIMKRHSVQKLLLEVGLSQGFKTNAAQIYKVRSNSRYIEGDHEYGNINIQDIQQKCSDLITTNRRMRTLMSKNQRTIRKEFDVHKKKHI